MAKASNSPSLHGAVGGDHVGMAELGRRANFTQEAFDGAGTIEQRLVDDFEDFEPVHELVLGQVDDAHAAAAQFAEDLILRIGGQFGRQIGDGGLAGGRGFLGRLEVGDRFGQRVWREGRGAAAVRLAQPVEEIIAGLRRDYFAAIGALIEMVHHHAGRSIVQFAQAERLAERPPTDGWWDGLA